ncbi:MAG: hypothetical protein ACOYOA_02810 [Saprospiraceae bacterium]
MDWLFLELRSGSPGSTSVEYTKSALLQADGDIVEIDGISPVSFPKSATGNYYVAIRHRNHIGFRTSNLIYLNRSTPLLNFTNNSIALNSMFALKAISGAISVMYSGDANSDGSVDAQDSILWDAQNGLYDDYLLNADFNEDGSIDAFDAINWEFSNGVFEALK